MMLLSLRNTIIETVGREMHVFNTNILIDSELQNNLGNMSRAKSISDFYQ